MKSMLEWLKAGPRALMRASGLYPHYYLARYGYLKDLNWFESYNRYSVIGRGGEPLPWITYGAIHFVEPRINAEMEVFEFGAGNSTLWWARRVRSVVSVEHAREWYETVKNRMPANVTLLLSSVPTGEYAREIARQGRQFDVVVIDGRDRVNCAINATSALTAGGVILWDNAERSEYSEGYEFLRKAGFRRVDFHGMGPRCVYGWTTSVFYRDGNCLNL